MFQLLNEKEEQVFFWDDIGDIQNGRRNLGEQMPVQMFRLFQFTIKNVLTERCGKQETIAIFRQAGELAGKEFAKNTLKLDLELDEFIEHLRKMLEEMKVGILRMEQFDAETGTAILTVAEDIDCSGLPISGETVCNYDEGFLAGILKVYTNRDYVVTEIDCWATGSRVCRFEAHVQTEE